MAINIPNYIKDKLRKAGSLIDTRPGSVWSDLVGNPLAHVLEDFYSYQDEVVKNQSLLNAEVMDDSTLEAMAANFLVTRAQGGYASGGVVLYFTTSQQITVPQGTIFATEDGLEYVTLSNYTISRQAMALNRDSFPLFNTQEIPVRSRGAGDIYNVNSGKIIKNKTWGGTPTKIANINPCIGGQERESNTALVERVRESVNGPNMSSIAGITKMLKSFFPSVQTINIIGTNNALMTRDLSVLTSLVESYQEEDFYMIYSGLTGSLAKPHRAYWGNFVDLDETASIALPRPDQFVFEFTDPMYEGLFYRDDLLTSDTEYETIIQEHFDWINVSGEVIPKPIEVVLASGLWELHDGQSPMIGADNKRGKPYNDEFAISSGGALRLGKHYNLDSDDFEMQVPYRTLLGLQELLVSSVGENESLISTEDATGATDTL